MNDHKNNLKNQTHDQKVVKLRKFSQKSMKILSTYAS